MAIVGLMSTGSCVSHSSIVYLRALGHITVFILDRICEQPWCEMAPWIHSHNLLLITPLWEGANVCGWLGIGEIRPKQIGLARGPKHDVP